MHRLLTDLPANVVGVTGSGKVTTFALDEADEARRWVSE